MKSFTSTFMMVCILAIAAYDIWVILSVGSEESISAYFLALGEVTPFVPSLMGFTMGHLFWPRKSIIHTWDYNYLSIGFRMLFAPPALYDVYIVWSGCQLIFPNYEFNFSRM